MKCTCGGNSGVTETRSRNAAASMRRVRKCLSCGERWSTLEFRVDHLPRGNRELQSIVVLARAKMKALLAVADELKQLIEPILAADAPKGDG